jgi:hypothetical protein
MELGYLERHLTCYQLQDGNHPTVSWGAGNNFLCVKFHTTKQVRSSGCKPPPSILHHSYLTSVIKRES